MRILEVFTQWKNHYAKERNEDGWIVTADFAAVIDGSTSKRPVAEGEKSGGQIAMNAVKKAILQLPAEATMQEAAQIFTEAVRETNPPEAATDATWRNTCSAAIYSESRREVWLMGDCQCRFNGQTHTNPKLVDKVLTEARSGAIRHLMDLGYSEEQILHDDLGRAFILDALKDQTFFQNDPDRNNPFRYTVIDGFKMDLSTIPVLPVGDSTHLILATDGYPFLFDTHEETELHLEVILREDPLCIERNAGTKGLLDGQYSYDDRTYLSLKI